MGIMLRDLNQTGRGRPGIMEAKLMVCPPRDASRKASNHPFG